jgi:hypothetical protein
MELLTPRPKVKIGDKNLKMGKVSECTIEKTLILKNASVALKVDSSIIRNDVKTDTVSETKISDIDSNQQDKKPNPVRCYKYTKKPVEEPKKKFETQYNLQNQNKIQLKWFS